jgi:hypothetical protein
MSREAHVRFCESLGLQRPGPLTKRGRKRLECEKQAHKRYPVKRSIKRPIRAVPMKGKR